MVLCGLVPRCIQFHAPHLHPLHGDGTVPSVGVLVVLEISLIEVPTGGVVACSIRFVTSPALLFPLPFAFCLLPFAFIDVFSTAKPR